MFLALLLMASLMNQAGAPVSARQDSGAQAAARYRIYDSTGRPASIEDVLAALDRVEVACIGEIHDDPSSHAFEAELLRRTVERYNDSADRSRRRPVLLSMEMFERDVQVVLDEYLHGLVTERHFLSSSRPWNNYEKDYRPLVEYAREHQLAVIAANAPARYVNRVARLGPNSLKELTAAARAWLPPLPYEAASPAYSAKFKVLMGGQLTGSAQGQPSPHSTAYLLDAQSLRDATMAYSIYEQLRARPAPFVLHINGNFHSEERLGVPEQLAHYRPQTRTLVITIVSDKRFPVFDAARMGRFGDFIILTDPLLPRSF